MQTILRWESIRSKVTWNRNSIKEPTFQSILRSLSRKDQVNSKLLDGKEAENVGLKNKYKRQILHHAHIVYGEFDHGVTASFWV